MGVAKILLVEDESALRKAVGEYLNTKNFDVIECDGVRSAIQALTQFSPDAAVLDYSLGDGNALQLMDHLKQLDPMLPVIILTAYGSIELAVEAIKKGAENFLTKPVELSALTLLLQRALESQNTRRNQRANNVQRDRRAYNPFIGNSAAVAKLADQAQRLRQSDSPILIQGETGTGKTVLARWLHSNGPRHLGPFVDFNCSTFSRELVESELFGFEKGSFTGAVNSKLGLFEVAHKGTIFLDEIGDMDLQIQPKLLKVLDEKQLRRIGELRERTIDVRLIAATHQDLSELVQEKKFRSDLYFRINTVPLRIPPLRERREDIPVLSQLLLTRTAADMGRPKLKLTDRAMAQLYAYSWPGNIRELRNVLERAVLLSDAPEVDTVHLQFEAPPKNLSGSVAGMTLLEMEKAMIAEVLREEHGRVPKAAERLGIPRSSLYQKIKTYGLTTTRDLP
ncbi:MAG TPA: sigma-54 dependent transcriptional regulator [Terriglobales bacterium]|nr:sigma-54 dependent transcriptional regulator [Terriglobales bacterium]